VAYKVGSGCTHLGTATGTVTGDWGTTGTVGISDRFTVHNVKISKDGQWALISWETCTSTCTNQATVFLADWDDESLSESPSPGTCAAATSRRASPTSLAMMVLRLASKSRALTATTLWPRQFRFAHTFNTDLNPNFSVAEAIGAVLQDGNYALWSSGWQGTLGSTAGNSVCTITTTCQGDVFIVNLTATPVF
jgi:hypothetical protein